MTTKVLVFESDSGLRGRAPKRARQARLHDHRRRRRQRRAAAGRRRQARPHPAVDRAAADERLLRLQQAEEGPEPEGRPAHHHVERVERRDVRAAQEAAHAGRGLRTQAHRLRRAASAHPRLRGPGRPAPAATAKRPSSSTTRSRSAAPTTCSRKRPCLSRTTCCRDRRRARPRRSVLRVAASSQSTRTSTRSQSPRSEG